MTFGEARRADLRRLIVTGDDFGASTLVNEAIELAHRGGILNTTSLIVAGLAADDAVRRAKRLPALKVGLHVVLVDGRPLLNPREIPSLVDENGEFSNHLVRAGFNFFFNPAARRQLDAEIRAQFEAFRATGLALDHVNAHNHMHLHPTVLRAIIDIGRGFGIRAARVPYEPLGPSWQATRDNFRGRFGNSVLLAPLLASMRARLRKAGIAYNDYVFGLSDTGRMTNQRVMQFLPKLPQGVTEMYFHPATRTWPGLPAYVRCEEELAALTNPAIVEYLRDSDIVMTTFSDLASARS